MAIDKKVQNRTTPVQPDDMPEGFQRGGGADYLYDPNKTQRPLQGFLTGLRMLPNGADGQPWEVAVIETTAATNVLDAHKDSVEVPPGSIVYLPMKAKLEELRVYAREDVQVEVWIRPKEKIGITGGKTMWTYAIGRGRVRPKPAARVAARDEVPAGFASVEAEERSNAQDDIAF